MPRLQSHQDERLSAEIRPSETILWAWRDSVIGDAWVALVYSGGVGALGSFVLFGLILPDTRANPLEHSVLGAAVIILLFAMVAV
ncbi:MAG: hypothetical protein AAGI53_12510 [Planctomycetota bacterium]